MKTDHEMRLFRNSGSGPKYIRVACSCGWSYHSTSAGRRGLTRLWKEHATTDWDRALRTVGRWRWKTGLDESTLTWTWAPLPPPGESLSFGDIAESRRWLLGSNRGTFEVRPSWAAKHEGNVPALESLDPFNYTRRGDGRRVVDMLALEIVVKFIEETRG